VKINDLITETVSLTENASESHDLLIIANKVVDKFPVEGMQYISKLVPQHKMGIENDSVFGMCHFILISTDPQHERSPNDSGYCQTFRDDESDRVVSFIWVRYRSSKKLMVNTLVHELRHALDFWKSDMNLPASKHPSHLPSNEWSDADYEVYYRDPKEVNARLMEVIEHITRDMIKVYDRGHHITANSSQVSTYVHNLFVEHNLSRGIFEKGPVGDKKYKRIFSRAVVFFQYILPIIEKNALAPDEPPPSKSIIRQWIGAAWHKVLSLVKI
jgi:hypothetical protein